VEQLPAISWKVVHGAVAYEYQLAADSRFNSIVLGVGPGKGANKTTNLAAALEKSVSDGTYYWRVRGLTAKGRVGAWSKTRRIVKLWNIAPGITGGAGVNISWPETPLVLRWSGVPYATKYIVVVATDPALSNPVLGTTSKPVETQATNFALPISLAPGPYYWAVTPVDAEGHRGVRSGVASFKWSWPTATSTRIEDLNPEAGVFDDPQFSWAPIAGAARYEVEINSAAGFPPGSKWCCNGTTTGTSLAPLQTLANNRYYWRVRALDARGDAGQWNEGTPFEKSFDPSTPSIHNLTVRDAEGKVLSPTRNAKGELEAPPATDTPIVTWDPVPGASRYEVQLGPHVKGLGCDFSKSSSTTSMEPTQVLNAFTASTAWTPLAKVNPLHVHVGPTAWPLPQRTPFGNLPASGATYCLRVLARSDDDAQRGQVVSSWTQVNGSNQPAFTYLDPPPAGAPGPEGLTTPASAYLMPATGQSTPRTPLFTWKRVAGAQGYFVVVARDPRFTEVADIGFTDVPAYAPRIYNESPLSDETTEYFWAVIPTQTTEGQGIFSNPCYPTTANQCEEGNDNPRTFNKSSGAPSLVSPGNGAVATAQPTFRWSAAENARNYRLQVSQDPTFGKLLDDLTTDATSYTSSSTYPADTTLYWRVRANDWIGQGLNWSPTGAFVRRLSTPVPGLSSPTTLFGPEPLSWTGVQGAISYDIQVEQVDGSKSEFSFESPSASFTRYWGTGIGHWRVRAEFPTGTVGKVAGPYSERESVLVLMGAPKGARGTRQGGKLLVSWHPEPDAKQYEVQIGPNSGFTAMLETHKLDGTEWAPDLTLTKAQSKAALYWRVAPVDSKGHVGAFASGRFGSTPPRCVARKAKKGKRAHKCPSRKRHTVQHSKSKKK
jgi:hypothetical protein